MIGYQDDSKTVFEARLKALEAAAKLWGKPQQGWTESQVTTTAARFEQWLLRPRGK